MNARAPKDPMLSDSRLAAELGISKITVFRWRKRGILPPATIISGRNFTKKSVAEQLKTHGDGSPAQKIPVTPAPAAPKRRPAQAESTT